MRLIDALTEEGDKVKNVACLRDKLISGITCDSRRVEPGFLFAAFSGSQFDGRTFISEALSNGAVAVLTDESAVDTLKEVDVPLIASVNPRQTYARVASRFYEPSPRIIAAITGTNGKTSTVSFLRQIWEGLGKFSSSIGTLGIEVSELNQGYEEIIEQIFNLTTPDSVDLHRSLQKLAERNINHIAIEASSHGLDQFRLDGLRISAAAFTNLSRDHLDYHGSHQDYLKAKVRLFDELLIDGGVAVINTADPYSEAFEESCRSRRHSLISYGYEGKEMKIISVEPLLNGQCLVVDIFGTRYEFKIPLIGAFQGVNIICATALAIGLGADIHETLGQIEKLTCIPGRVQLVGCNTSGAPIYVDYAHTPDALSSLLYALRPHAEKELCLVFGCGGDRDPGKRAQMGKIARRLADRVIITDDNPRTENASAIREEIMMSCPNALNVGNREQAIRIAIENLKENDLLVVAGKGHEIGQIVGETSYDFNDSNMINKILSESVG